MYDIFSFCGSYDQNIGGCNVSKVTNKAEMFYKYTDFNRYIGGWKVDKVTNISDMFQGC